MTARRSQFKFRKSIIAQLVGKIFVGGMVLGAAMPASALNCTWNPATGNWGTSCNWTCAAVPGAADSATIAVTKTVTIDTGQSILNLTNAGSVNIDQFGLNLVGGGSTINTGTINVGGAITANLGVSAGHNINNTGGVISVADGSVINQFGSSISGGTINTTGTGKLQAFNNGSNFLSGVTLNGTLDLATGTGIERVNGGLTLGGPGNINMAAGSILSFEGTQTIGGNGAVNFGATASTIQLNGAGTTTIGANVAIQRQNGNIGGGQTFIGGANTLVNNGTIAANVSGGTINLTGTGGAGVTNNNTMEARNGATLNIQNVGVTQGGSGQINALTGSVVQQTSATITGGTINTSGTGVFRASNSGSNILTGVTLAGVLDLATAVGIERVVGGLTLNSGTININNNSVLALNANQTIGGTGTIVFGNTGANNRITLEATGGAGPVTLGANIVIRGENGTIGAGQIIAGGFVNLINNGRISADVAGGTINLASAAGGNTTNNGILEAQNGGTLLLSSNIIGNPGGQVVAGAGSAVVQNSVTISGTLNTSGSGVFRTTNSASNILDGVTLNGNLDMTTASIERVVNGLTLNGNININNNSILALNANVSITNASPDAFTEALKVQAGAAPSGFTLGANPANIAAQGTGTLQVNLNTGTAGTFGGNLTLNHISTGEGTTGAPDIGVGSSNVTLNGKVYTVAAATVQPSVNFGIVHVGDVVAAQGVSVQNSAPATALNDTLRASIGGATGPFTSNNAAVAGLVAGAAANTTALTVGLNTNTAGVFNGGTATVGLRSQNPDMADAVLDSQNVTLNAQVNNYANALFDKVSGAGSLSRSGSVFTLNFGTVARGSACTASNYLDTL